MVCTDTAALSISLFKENLHYEDAEDCHSFVAFTSSALEGLLVHRYLWRTMWHHPLMQPNLEHTVSNLLSCVEQAVHLSNQRQWRNCGSYHPLRWVEYLTIGCATHPSFLKLVPPTLVHELAIAHERGLLDIGNEGSIQIAQLIGYMVSSPLPDSEDIASPGSTLVSHGYETPAPNPDIARTHETLEFLAR